MRSLVVGVNSFNPPSASLQPKDSRNGTYAPDTTSHAYYSDGGGASMATIVDSDAVFSRYNRSFLWCDVALGTPAKHNARSTPELLKRRGDTALVNHKTLMFKVQFL